MKQLLREIYQLANTEKLRNPKTGKEFYCVYIDPKTSTDQTYGNEENKKLIMSYGAEWLPYNKREKMTSGVPHAWGWIIYDGEENEKYPLINKFAQEIGSKETPVEGGNPRTYDEVLDSISHLRDFISKCNIPVKDAVLKNAEEYEKLLIQGIGSPETMEAINQLAERKRKLDNIAKANGARNYSWFNTMIIQVMKPNAIFVTAKGKWLEKGYTINKDAKPLFLSRPKKIRTLFGQQRTDAINEYLREVGVSSEKELNPFQKDALKIRLTYADTSAGYDTYVAYDVTDVTPGPNSPKIIMPPEFKDDFKWFVEMDPTDKDNICINACIKYGLSIGITEYSFLDKKELGSARGYATNTGRIAILDKERDLGIVKTAIHETAHEIMHFPHVSKATPSLKKFYRGDVLDRDIKEQEADLTAWITMKGLGYPIMQEGFNYMANWGMNVQNCSKVFRSILEVANTIFNGIITNIDINDMHKYW